MSGGWATPLIPAVPPNFVWFRDAKDEFFADRGLALVLTRCSQYRV